MIRSRDIQLHACRFDAITEENVIQDVERLAFDQVWINGERIDH